MKVPILSGNPDKPPLGMITLIEELEEKAKLTPITLSALVIQDGDKGTIQSFQVVFSPGIEEYKIREQMKEVLFQTPEDRKKMEGILFKKR